MHMFGPWIHPQFLDDFKIGVVLILGAVQHVVNGVLADIIAYVRVIGCASFVRACNFPVMLVIGVLACPFVLL